MGRGRKENFIILLSQRPRLRQISPSQIAYQADFVYALRREYDNTGQRV